jgi:hypothetical protein
MCASEEEAGGTMEVAGNTGGDEIAPIKKTPTGEPNDKPKKGLHAPSSNSASNTKVDFRLAKLKSEIEKKQMEIAGSQYGVDADQMFKYGDDLVLIGMRQEDVNLIFADLIPAGSRGGDVETITFKSGILNQISFHFVNGFLYKVVVDYRIGPPEAMKQLLNDFRELYGDSIEQEEALKKEQQRLARLAAIKHLCKKGKHKWTKKGICKICKVRKADLEPPKLKLDQTLTWKGKIMTAQIHLKLTPKADNFTLFVLTKENSELKETQERILEEERKERAEAEKRKRIEEYQKQLK